MIFDEIEVHDIYQKKCNFAQKTQMWGPLHCTCRALGVFLTLIKLASLFVWIREPIQGCGGGLLGSCEMPCWRREGRILGIWNCASWKQMYKNVGGTWSHFGQCLSGNMHWCCRQRRQMSFTLGDWWEIVALMASQGCQVFSWVVVSNIVFFHPYLGKVSILTNIFQIGWNHQLVQFRTLILGGWMVDWLVSELESQRCSPWKHVVSQEILLCCLLPRLGL